MLKIEDDFQFLIDLEKEKLEKEYLSYFNEGIYSSSEYKEELLNLEKQISINIGSKNNYLFKDLKIKDFIKILSKNKINQVVYKLNNLSIGNEILKKNYIESPFEFYMDDIEYMNLRYEFQSDKWKNKFSLEEAINYLNESFKKSTKIQMGEIEKIWNSFELKIFLNSFEDRTIEEVIYIINKELEKNLNLLRDENNPKIEYFYKIDKIFRTGIKQYLAYFNDFVMNTKGISIDFDLESCENGLILKLDKKQNIDLIGRYFSEYIGFLKCLDIEAVKPNYEITKTNYDKSIEIMQLKEELRSLKHKHDIIKTRLECKECEVEKIESIYKDMINKFAENKLHKNQEAIGVSVINTNINTNSNSIGLKEIEQFQRDIEKIKDILEEVDYLKLKEELNEIDKVALEIGDKNDLKKEKRYLNLFKRIINNITDEDSMLNKTIKASKQGKKIFDTINPLIPGIVSNIEKLKELISG